MTMTATPIYDLFQGKYAKFGFQKEGHWGRLVGEGDRKSSQKIIIFCESDFF